MVFHSRILQKMTVSNRRKLQQWGCEPACRPRVCYFDISQDRHWNFCNSVLSPSSAGYRFSFLVHGYKQSPEQMAPQNTSCNHVGSICSYSILLPAWMWLHRPCHTCNFLFPFTWFPAPLPLPWSFQFIRSCGFRGRRLKHSFSIVLALWIYCN